MSEHPKTKKVRVLIISDTHTAELHPESEKDHAFRKPLPKADVLLHCGDLTRIGFPGEYEATIRLLQSIDAELKLVIAGNHDITLDDDFYRTDGRRMHGRLYDQEYPNRARELWSKAREHAIFYLDEGVHSFTLRSNVTFTVYASPYQPEFCKWAFAYEHNEDRFNPTTEAAGKVKPIAVNPVPDFPNIDIMMTHGPPFNHLDRTLRNADVGCPHLLRALCRARPKLHAFGHIHEAWGAERLRWRKKDECVGIGALDAIERVEQVEVDEKRAIKESSAYLDVSQNSADPLRPGEETVLVNASIMTVRYRPMNAPWLVDLDLPVASEAPP